MANVHQQKKSVCMTITAKKNPSNFSYVLEGTVLTKVNQHKYSGVPLTSTLQWDSHIDIITSTALRKLFFLRRRLRLAPWRNKLLAYTTFVRPILKYTNVVWFPHTISNRNKMERVQKKPSGSSTTGTPVTTRPQTCYFLRVFQHYQTEQE